MLPPAMKIVVVAASLAHGGASIVAQDVARGMAGRQHTVRLVCAGDEDARYDEDGVEVVVLGQRRRSRAFQYANPELVARLALELRRVRPDVVHVHNINLRSFSLASLLLLRRYPTVWTLHDVWAMCLIGWPMPPGWEGMRDGCHGCPCGPSWQVRLNRALKEGLYRAVRLHVACPSGWMADLVASSSLGRQPVEVVPNGVDTAMFCPEGERSRPTEAGNRKVLLFSGGTRLADRLPADRKGWRQLAEALQLLGTRRDDLHLLYVGDRLELPPDFAVPTTFVAGVQRDGMPAYYRGADAFVLPTLADNQPLTVLEAMACGTPVIASRAGGIPEMIADSDTGWLCDVGDAGDLAAALERFLDDDSASATTERALAHVRRHYDTRNMVAGYERLYEVAQRDFGSKH